MNKLKVFGITILIASFFGSCNGQPDLNQQCNNSYRNANFSIADYAKSYNKENLRKALISLDTSIRCENTKAKSIALKITIFSLLEDYSNGLDFVKSLDESDFDRPYKKKMYSDIFYASQLSTSGDTAKSKLVYSNAVSDIKQFLLKSGGESKSIDKDVHSILVFIQSKYLTLPEILAELDALKVKFPKDSVFIDSLKETVLSKDDFLHH